MEKASIRIYRHIHSDRQGFTCEQQQAGVQWQVCVSGQTVIYVIKLQIQESFGAFLLISKASGAKQ